MTDETVLNKAILAAAEPVSTAPITRVTMKSRRTKAGQWAVYFTFQGKKREFVRPDLADAVMAAGAFLESYAPIGLMRISQEPH